MAPTETLAEQHFATLQALMPRSDADGAAHGLDAQGRRRELLARLAGGRARTAGGGRTPSSRPVVVRHLAVAVVDEQHRFGSASARHWTPRPRPGFVPDVLHMTATPIPRTLRLAGFGAWT